MSPPYSTWLARKGIQLHQAHVLLLSPMIRFSRETAPVASKATVRSEFVISKESNHLRVGKGGCLKILEKENTPSLPQFPLTYLDAFLRWCQSNSMKTAVCCATCKLLVFIIEYTIVMSPCDYPVYYIITKHFLLTSYNIQESSLLYVIG